MRRFDFKTGASAAAGLCEAGDGSAAPTCGVTDPAYKTRAECDSGPFEATDWKPRIHTNAHESEIPPIRVDSCPFVVPSNHCALDCADRSLRRDVERPSPLSAPLLTPTLSSQEEREKKYARLGMLIAALAMTAALCQTTFAEESGAQPDPAAHTVIVPYDATRPLEGQKAERYFLPYEAFQRLWELAKENRRPAKPDEDETVVQASIQSALYRGKVVERGLELEARLSVATRGKWAELPLDFAMKDAPGGVRIGSVTVDEHPAAIGDKGLRFERPGLHEVRVELRCDAGEDWRVLELQLPRAVAAWASVETPAADGWLRVNGGWASASRDSASARIFTHSLGALPALTLERSTRGLDRGEGPVPAATVAEVLRIPELGPEQFEAAMLFNFPGANRRTLVFALDPDLEITTLSVALPEGDRRSLELARVSDRAAADGSRRIEIELRQEINDAARVFFQATRTPAQGTGRRESPRLRPMAGRTTHTLELRHHIAHEVAPVTGGGVRRTQASSTQSSDGWVAGGSFDLQGGPGALAYDIRPADTQGEVTADYVFQISEQKCELLAAIDVAMKNGFVNSLRLALPDGYEVQSVTSPHLRRWQQEASVLHIHFDAAQQSREARLAVHLARTTDQPAAEWTLEPIAIEGFGKVRGTAIIAAHAAVEVRLPGFARTATLDETDPGALSTIFAIAPPIERKRALSYEQTDWSVTASLAREEPRFRAESVLLTAVSDAGIRLSQHVTVDVERGAIRALRLQLPASLPEARVTGPLLREMRSSITGETRNYECTFQTDVLDQTQLVLDLDLPLGSGLDAPFLAVPDAQQITRFVVLDNASSRESRVTNPAVLEKVTRESLPFLPDNLSRPEFFRGIGDGPLSIAFSELNQTEGNAAIVTLAEITTVLRADGERWDTVRYSLLNRSLQFLPVVLPPDAELMAARVSGEVVRVDEEARGGRTVKLVPLIHTRPGERGLDVELVYRMSGSKKGLPRDLTLDDPELDGLSVEHTTWSVWTPEGWRVSDSDGNMTEATESSMNQYQKVAAVSMIKAVTQRLLSGELEYDDAQAALKTAEKWIEELGNSVQSRDLYSSASRYSDDDGELQAELAQQRGILTENRKRILDSSRENSLEKKRKLAEGKKQTDWNVNGNVNPADAMPSDAFKEEFVQQQGAQVLNDNIAVSNGFLYKDAPQGQAMPSITSSGGVTLGFDMQGRSDSIDGMPNLGGFNNAINSNARGNKLSQMQQEMDQRREQQMREMERLEQEQAKMNRMSVDPFGGPPAAGADPFASAPPSRADLDKATPVPSAKPQPSDLSRIVPGSIRQSDEKAQDIRTAGRKAVPPPPPPEEPEPLLVQSVESLRPTGRRSLNLDVPTNGSVMHFTKLKDHALIELKLKPEHTSSQTGSLWIFGFALAGWLASRTFEWHSKRKAS